MSMSSVVETHRLSDSNLFKQVRIGTGFIRFESGRHRLKPVAGLNPNLRLQLWRWFFVAMSPVATLPVVDVACGGRRLWWMSPSATLPVVDVGCGYNRQAVRIKPVQTGLDWNRFYPV